MEERDAGQILAKRDAAAKARRLAQWFVHPMDRGRVLLFADELDAQADALERSALSAGQP